MNQASMSLSHEHEGSKISAKINTYMLTRAELLMTLSYEIPCTARRLRNTYPPARHNSNKSNNLWINLKMVNVRNPVAAAFSHCWLFVSIRNPKITLKHFITHLKKSKFDGSNVKHSNQEISFSRVLAKKQIIFDPLDQELHNLTDTKAEFAQVGTLFLKQIYF